MNGRNGKDLKIAVVANTSVRRELLKSLAPKGMAWECLSPSVSQLQRLRSSRVDVVVFDVDGPVAAESLLWLARDAITQFGLVALIDTSEPQWISEALRLGVNAIVSREIGRDELGLAIEAAEAGMVLLLPSSVQEILSHFPSHDVDELLEPLTAREGQVLSMLGDGIGNKEIAARLSISEHTVKFHISSILGKLQAETRTEAVRRGIERGLIAI